MISIPCPQCQKPTLYDTRNPSRPFCSPRCKLLDYGDWATEQHRISQPLTPLDEELLVEPLKNTLGPMDSD